MRAKAISLLFVLAVPFLVASPTLGVVVTDNNLLTQGLGTLTATTSQVSSNFQVVPDRLVGVSATVTALVMGVAANTYRIDGISTNATATTSDLFVTTIGNFSPMPLSYNQLHNLVTASTVGRTNLYYNLGVGRGDLSEGGLGGWDWQASTISAYQPAGADAGLGFGGKTLGNLVPNASFEDSSIRFFNIGSYVATNAAKQGAAVFQNLSTADSHIGLPVTPGVNYFYSFWAAAPVSGGGNQVEWGLFVPADGFAVTPGNSSGGPPAGFGEFTGTFTPGPGQTTFYIGGMSNGGVLWFDSVFVAQIVPEPGVVALLALGGLIAWRRRRNG